MSKFERLIPLSPLSDPMSLSHTELNLGLLIFSDCAELVVVVLPASVSRRESDVLSVWKKT